MIPSLKLNSIHIAGPISVQPFGLLVVTGVWMGALWIRRRAKKQGIPAAQIDGMIGWAVIPGFIAAHLVETFFYEFDRLSTEGPLLIFKIWDGISSFGGVFGGALGWLWFTRSFDLQRRRQLLDLIAQGLVIGWIFGRTGCTLVMDHPGGYTDFFLGFQTHDGVRHNLGFYELIYTIVVLIPAMWVWGKPDATPGRITALLALLYAPARFGLDFLRSTDQVRSDPRYLGLTFGHYSSLFCIAIGAWMLWRQREGTAKASAPRRSEKNR